MIKKFSSFILNYLPSAYIFAILLTFLIFILAILFTPYGFKEITLFWGNSFFDLLKFAMQMSLILVAGCVLADTPSIKRGLKFLASFAKTNTSAVVYATLLSLFACYINWGLGLIVSSIFALKVHKKEFNFPLIVASSYSGFLIWHGGLSGSIPLKLTDLNISIKDSLFSHLNLTLLLVTSFCLVSVNFLMSKVKNYKQISPIKLDNALSNKNPSFLSDSKLLKYLLIFVGVSYLFFYFQNSSLNLNIMIFIFIFAGLIFHKNQFTFVESFEKNIKASSGIILQFMLYAGIMGIVSKSGLANDVSEFFISISSKDSFLVNTYLSAGIINFVVPSGGGQWAIQGPMILDAAKAVGVSEVHAAMAIAWGDAWTNMVQPFWALPILKITGLDLNYIMGYLFVIFTSIGVVTITTLFMLS